MMKRRKLRRKKKKSKRTKIRMMETIRAVKNRIRWWMLNHLQR
jgi:hypothetical protein